MVANDNCSACEFQNGLASSRRYDENRLERNRKPLGRRVQHSNGWRGGSEPNLFKHVGLEAREIPAVGEVFSLDFPLYRTSSPPSKKGEDSYEAWFGFNQSTFGGFLFHRSALLRRISAGFTSGLPGPRSCDKRNIHQRPAPCIPVLKNGKNGPLRRIWQSARDIARDYGLSFVTFR